MFYYYSSDITTQHHKALPVVMVTVVEASGGLTSLNSGLRVFFITVVLCFDLFWMSGFRYLTDQEEKHRQFLLLSFPQTHETDVLTAETCVTHIVQMLNNNNKYRFYFRVSEMTLAVAPGKTRRRNNPEGETMSSSKGTLFSLFQFVHFSLFCNYFLFDLIFDPM